MSEILKPVEKARASARKMLDDRLSPEAVGYVQFSEPPGDPGLFGPDTAIWKVHEHVSTYIGLGTGTWIQALDPFMTAAMDIAKYIGASEDIVQRQQRFFSFILGMTYASRPVAERCGAFIASMHEANSGTMRDGRPWAASDPATQRFAHAAFAYGFWRAHRTYHPHPLPETDRDRYLAEYAVLGRTMGVPDPPLTWAQMAEVFDERRNVMCINENALDFFRVIEGLKLDADLGGLRGRAADFGFERYKDLINWASWDLLPGWARHLWRFSDDHPLVSGAKRRMLYALFNAAHRVAGTPQHILTASARACATPPPDTALMPATTERAGIRVA